MADKYSIDDILAEIDRKKSGVDNNLKAKDKKPKKEPEKRSALSTTPSITEEIENIIKKPVDKKEIKPKKPSELQEIKAEGIPLQEEKVVLPEKRESIKTQIQKRPAKTNIRDSKSKDVFFTKAKNVPKPLIEDIHEIKKAHPKDIEITPYKGTEAKFILEDETYDSDPNEKWRKRKNLEDTDNIEVFDHRYKPPKFSDTANMPPLKTTRTSKPVQPRPLIKQNLQKELSLWDELELEIESNPQEHPIKSEDTLREAQLRLLKEQSILKADKEMEHHDDIIEGINPYEVIKKAEEELLDIERTMVIGDLSGDTQGVAGEDLKELADKAANLNQAAIPTAEVGVKSYIPSEKKKKEPEPLKSNTDIPAVRTDTALLDSINKVIKERQRQEELRRSTLPINFTDPDISNSITRAVQGGSGPAPGWKPTRGMPGANVLNIDYKKQVLKDTTLVPNEDILDVHEKIEKLNELGEKRRRKIQDFVLEGREEEFQENDEEAPEDFDGYNASEQIWEDLCESHRALKFRFLILFIITGFLTAVTICNDFGINLAYRILGIEVVFLDRRFHPTSHIIMQLLLGFVGLVVCKGVLSDGLKKLFTRRGDCDGICAVSSVMAVAGAALTLADPQSFQSGQAHLYVTVGLGALLFNTVGKLMMTNRAKRNFRFVSGDGAKYYGDIIKDTELAGAFTKGVTDELPILCTMRKTEFLTDFLKSSYCNDVADATSKTLTPIAFLVSILIGFIAFFFGVGDSAPQNNIVWGTTACVGVMSAFSSFSIMIAVNNPFRRASKQLLKNDATVLGYDSAMSFADVNSVLVDANLLFPAGCVTFRSIKGCQNKNSLNKIAIDEAIITAASLAIKSGSILSNMFYDMIAGKSEMLYDIENSIYEVNMGITGWIGNRRIMLGNRKQMEHHSIGVPSKEVEQKYVRQNGDVVYLAVSGEAVAMFFIEILPNPEIKRCMQELYLCGVSVAVRSRDSLVTVNKIADVFDIMPDKIKILPFNLHEKFEECVKYTSRGRGDLSCNGTFTSLATALITAKKLVKDISYSAATVMGGSFIALILGTIFMLFAMTDMFSASAIMLYNFIWLGVMLIVQSLRKYG